MKTCTCVLASVLSLVVPVRHANAAESRPAPDIRIIQSTAQTIILEYQPAYQPASPVRAEGQTCLRLPFAGAVPLAPFPVPGLPLLQGRRLGLTLPSREGNTVRILEASFEDLPATLLAPAPFSRTRDSIFSPDGYTLNDSAYRTSGLQPGTTASLSPAAQVRSLLAATLTLAPVQFDPAARIVRRYSRMVVQITYGSPGVSMPDHPDAALLGQGSLNGFMAGPHTQSLTKTRDAGPSVLASGKWIRLTIADDGLYRLDAASLAAAGLNPAGADPRTFRLFGNGGKELPENIALSRPSDLLENAIFVEGEADGKFDPGDYILFYGKGVRGWTYNRTSRRLEHYINRYTETNAYWLTVGGIQGKRMGVQQSEPPPAALVPDRFQDAVFVEEERVKPVASGKDWYGRLLNSESPAYTYYLALPGLVPGSPLRFRSALAASSLRGPVFTLRTGTGIVAAHGLSPVSAGSEYTLSSGEFEAGGIAPPAASLALTCQFKCDDAGGSGYLDWLEAHYMRFFAASGDYLHFWGAETSGTVEYQLQQFSQVPRVFNVTVPWDVRQVQGVAGNALFRARESAGVRSEYVAATPATWKSPAALQSVPNQDLHGSLAGGADYVIVTTAGLRSAADRLAALRRQSARGGFTTVVVDIAQIYNEYSGGLPDVTALRDFLRFAWDHWQRKPQYVLLLGSGSYDYKGILGPTSSLVPTWESDESRSDVYGCASDDFFAALGGDSRPWLVLGRIPSRSQADAHRAVEKIIHFEEGSSTSPWALRMLFIADDAWSSDREYQDGTQFSEYVESLASEAYTPGEFEKRKIHIAEYPTAFEMGGRRKPGAYEDIIKEINDGMSIVHFAGHGRQDQLAHENIFHVETSLPRLTNADRLAMFYLATCAFSQFDDPQRSCGGELLLNKPDGGAIAVVAATRKVFSDNGLFADVHPRTFRRDGSGRLTVERPAAALCAAKVWRGNWSNDQRYFFMGDPALRLQVPAGHASIDSINGLQVDSADGRQRRSPLRLSAFSTVTVQGSMRDSRGAVDTSFQGSLTLQVNDASQSRTIVNFSPGVDFSYVATGGVIFRGEHSVHGGRFEARFVVPRDIAYGDSAGRGRILAYVRGTEGGAVGYTGNISIGGTDSTARNDLAGPRISLFLENRSFRPGDLVGPHPTFLADLCDSNGINTSKAGIGHRIEAWVNGGASSLDLTDLYVSRQDRYTEGTVQFPLTGLQPGRNSIRVRAWDTFDNSGEAEIFFHVTSAGEALAIGDLFNYPNPFGHAGTFFTFRRTRQAQALRVRIRIFTVAGRPVQWLESMVPAGELFAKIPWDGRDRDGDLLANGVYLYTLAATTDDGLSSVTTQGKLAVLR